MKLFVVIICLLFISCTKKKAYLSDYTAYNFHHEEQSCKAWIPKIEKDKFSKVLVDKMKARGWIPMEMPMPGKLFEGELYFSITKEILSTRPRYVVETKNNQIKRKQIGETDLVFKDCRVTVELKRSESPRVLPTDKALYKKIVIRKMPRITPGGNERCRRALKDAFLHIPYCLTPDRANALKRKFQR